ncbi:MAG: polysaccharide biosynthesis protein [Phycisphaerales bacterium]|nr:polysaccharide biosynthesis protein [Phycisphaerales bacterium]
MNSESNSFLPSGHLDLSRGPSTASTAQGLDLGNTVIIGTAATVPALIAQLMTLPSPPPLLGCVLVEPVSEPQKHHPVLGSLSDLPRLHGVLGFHAAIISLPASMSSELRRARSLLRELSIAERIVPPLAELIACAPGGTPRTGEVDPVELIGRTPYGIDRRAVARTLGDRCVLITGAGGSIGSEIARIVATFSPRQIVLLERSENALFEIDRQIASRFPDVPRKAILHDVVDADQTLRLLVSLRPDVVFHAAAHKHVPLMEDHPSHAVTNNLFGTKSIADASLAVGVDRFVLISSDKAVNPTSVMGATKRLAEKYIQALHRQSRADGASRTLFSMVRFGNVLGSACSVLPIWTRQIAEGGPVTVTDPRMTRYFMTIHEAATLVIQAGAMEPLSRDIAGVYVLDMGEPVKILDLARRFVRAHGYVPQVHTPLGGPVESGDGPTMEVLITGARPGEKLHEQLAYAAEQLSPTNHPGINAWKGELGDQFNLAAMIADLASVRTSADRDAVINAIRRHVPEMTRPGTAALESLESKQIPDDTLAAA